MLWTLSYRCDPQARVLADRHYSRQSIGASNFVPPGRCLVLRAPQTYWVTSFPYAEFVRHAWAGAWMCSAFRNEGSLLSSDLIREAVAVTRQTYGAPPALGMVTFVNPKKVKGFFGRTKEGPELRWGYSFWQAGFKYCGWTKGGLYALQLLPCDMPAPLLAKGTQLSLVA